MNTLLDLAAFLVELLGDLRYRTRRASMRGVWAWLTDGSGVRLIVLTVSIAYLLWARFGQA